MDRSTPLSVPALGTSRRTLLHGGGLAVLALGGGGLLAACSGESGADPAATAGPDTASPQVDGSPTAEPSASGEESGGETDSGGSGGLTIDAATVPVGGGIILSDAAFVVTQPEAGQFKAFDKICTHQGCPVSEVADAEIVCFCHGSKFSISDGSVVQGPADQGLAETPVTESGGQLTIG